MPSSPSFGVRVIIVLFCLANASKTVHSAELGDNEFKRDCDKDQCDLIVTRCTITDRCNCNVKQDAKCAKDCVDCLEEKFGKCCACVGLCPPAGSKVDDSPSSHVGELYNSDQQLFETLTEMDDYQGRWSVASPTATGLQVSHPELGQIEFAYRRQPDNNQTGAISHDTDLEKLKCTVAFINKRLGMAKCKLYCTSMGASIYRWFPVGCCECVGKHCFYFGIAKPQCNLSGDDEEA